jgi:hypothetical protein
MVSPQSGGRGREKRLHAREDAITEREQQAQRLLESQRLEARATLDGAVSEPTPNSKPPNGHKTKLKPCWRTPAKTRSRFEPRHTSSAPLSSTRPTRSGSGRHHPGRASQGRVDRLGGQAAGTTDHCRCRASARTGAHHAAHSRRATVSSDARSSRRRGTCATRRSGERSARVCPAPPPRDRPPRRSQPP